MRAGDIVKVDNPQFTGYGEFRYAGYRQQMRQNADHLPDPVKCAAVLLENGNTWLYDLDTVSRTRRRSRRTIMREKIPLLAKHYPT